MSSEDYSYGLEDGYGDARAGQVHLPDEDDDYRHGYEDGLMRWRKEQADG